MELDRKTLEEVSLNDDVTGSSENEKHLRIGALKLREVLQRKKATSVFRIRGADSAERSNSSPADVDSKRKTSDIKTDARYATLIDNTNKASRRQRDEPVTSSTRARDAQTTNTPTQPRSAAAVSSNGGSSLESARRALRARHKMLSLSTASERSFSTDSDPDIADMMGFADSGSRLLVEQLLFDIYDRWHCAKRRDSFDSDPLTGCSSTSDALGGRNDVMHGSGTRFYEARLNRANLANKGR